MNDNNTKTSPVDELIVTIDKYLTSAYGYDEYMTVAQKLVNNSIIHSIYQNHIVPRTKTLINNGGEEFYIKIQKLALECLKSFNDNYT